MFHYRFFIIIVLAFALGSCSEKASEGEQLKSSPEAEAFNTNNNRFGLAMFQQLNQKKEDQPNIVVSPVSAAMASGMTLNGTGGETRRQLAEVLGWQEKTDTQVNEYHKRLINYYNQHSGDISLNIANAIWNDRDVDVFPEFIRTNKEYFSAFHNQSENQNFVSEINDWVQRSTQGNIKEMMKGSQPGDMLYILNAIYFRGDWKHEFNASQTTDSYFYLEDGSRKPTRMMWQKADLNYYRNGIFQMVELPYENESFSMYILLPDSTIDMNRLVSKLDMETWQRHKNNLSRKRNINFGMPRFSCEYSVGMKELMESMGIRDLFDNEEVNLSGISDQPVSISEVMHKAAIDVDEKGTEATAATSLAKSFTTLVDDKPFNLVVNRPFVFAIEEKKSNAMLFIGKISNP
ncbi:MAG: serpin family protein [Bacteroidota bacterium]